MAACDKVTSLKFKNRSGVLCDNDWIAGMEYGNKTRIILNIISMTKTIKTA